MVTCRRRKGSFLQPNIRNILHNAATAATSVAATAVLTISAIAIIMGAIAICVVVIVVDISVALPFLTEDKIALNINLSVFAYIVMQC